MSRDFDRLHDLTASHKAAFLIRHARRITWDADVHALIALGIAPALRLEGPNGKRAQLDNALYRGRVGVRRGEKAAATHYVITSEEGEPIATLDMPVGFELP